MPQSFGQTQNGATVQRHVIAAEGLSASLISYGARLQDLRLKGCDFPLVLGYSGLAAYLDDQNYFGAIVGRTANRTHLGRALIDGKPVQLDVNEPPNHLHGGGNGSAFRVWDLVDHGPTHVTFRDVLPDDHMGYPGALRVDVTYRICAATTLEIEITATCDAATLCNFAPHSYFNLSDQATIDGHRLAVHASDFTPTDAFGIPTGKVARVAATAQDFREARALETADRLDVNYCLSPQKRKAELVAELVSPDGKISMQVETTEPGLQVYTGDGINGGAVVGLSGKPYAARAGIALETQVWPDAINHNDFPSAVLRPGETYRHISRFRFVRIG